MAINTEVLEILLLKDGWEKEDVISFLNGHTVKRPVGDPTRKSEVHNLITGEKVSGNERDSIVQRHKDIRGIWEMGQHSMGVGNIKRDFDMKYDGWIAPRDYVLRWAYAKHNGTAKVWEGFRECIRVALEQGWITPKDYETPQEEIPPTQTPEEVLSEAFSAPEEDNPESPKELKNRMRLIGVLADMLKDDSIALEDKKNAFKIASYINNKYAPGVGNKGIGLDTVEKTLGKAKALLEDEGIISKKPKK